jgi:transcriptional regulator with XRE-family HTH domain
MARSEFAVAFGQVVRQERERRGLSQEALAAEAGIHRTHVSFIERGVHVASLEVALRVAGAFGMTVTQLVGRAERRWRRDA